MISIFKRLFNRSSEPIENHSEYITKPNMTKEEVLNEIYSLEPIKSYISKIEKTIELAKVIREKYFLGNYSVQEKIERFALQGIGYKFVYTVENIPYEIDGVNLIIKYHFPEGIIRKRHYVNMLHLCVHIYKKHTTTHEFGELLYDNEYIKKSEQEAFFLAKEILTPFEGLLDKIAELYSEKGRINVEDVDYDDAPHISLRLMNLGLEKYIDLNYSVFKY